MTAKKKLPKKSAPRKSYKPRKENALTSYISIPVDLKTKNKYKSLGLVIRKQIVAQARQRIVNAIS